MASEHWKSKEGLEARPYGGWPSRPDPASLGQPASSGQPEQESHPAHYDPTTDKYDGRPFEPEMISYKNIMLTAQRHAPTNTGWMSVLVVILLTLCGMVTLSLCWGGVAFPR